MFGAVGFFEGSDMFEMDDQKQETLDLSFLEAMESAENLFGINQHYFESLGSMTPKRQLVPSLHESVFVETVEHAVWNSNSWPNTSKHFPN